MDVLLPILQKHWGYTAFRSLQPEAMRCVVQGRDSVVILPTGGGKSLCFQAPALHLPGLAIVVSPLISLMKDQVDALVDNGVPAACVNSSQSFDERRQTAEDIRAGRLKLLYLSPEKLMTEKTLAFLQSVPISFLAVDEAHCISDWGHDFRPEYRMLSRLKEAFPDVGVHAYTATATERVRQDIARELNLRQPTMLVGSFDRPNLIYRVERRTVLLRQVLDVINRHDKESGIIYCIRRADVDELCLSLQEERIPALPYHAGLLDEVRRKNQDDFQADRARIIVATVAFGMGIDKSDVRFVIHAGAPKSLEHYQQESGRAGRDGLEAECCLLYSGGDFAVWRKIQSDLPREAYEIAMSSLAGIQAFASGFTCRRKAILRHFGQDLDADNCGSCDVCLGDKERIEDELRTSQMILSAVVRLKESFGADYTAQTLLGSREARILTNGHDKLSTYGLLASFDKRVVRDWIEQLVSQNYLEKRGEYAVLGVTQLGRKALKGESTPRLLKPTEKPRREAKASIVGWEGVDRELFDALREWRKKVAEQRRLPPFVVFADTTLRDLARRRPSTRAGLLDVHGIGEKKLEEYGDQVLEWIADHCLRTGLTRDVASAAFEPRSVSEVSGAKRRAFGLFSEGKSIDQVMQALDRARSTALQYLVEFISQEGISDPSAWIDRDTMEKVRATAARVGSERMAPIFEAHGGAIPYDSIRIALACLRNEPPALHPPR